MAVDNGEVLFANGATFPKTTELKGGNGMLGHENNTAGFSIEAVDEMGLDADGQKCRSIRIDPGSGPV